MAHLGIGEFIFYVVPLLLLGNYFLRKPDFTVMGLSGARLRRVYLWLLTASAVAALLLIGRIIWHTILVPPGWDFQGLWLYGKVVDAGKNPYVPAWLQAFAGPGPFVPDFREEVLNVGAVYPPPSLLVFASVGWLPLQVAIIPWMIVQTAAFVAMVVLLARTFLPDQKWEGVALMFTLAALLSGSIATFGHGQVNFLAVLLVLLAWRSRNRAVSGAYMAGAVILKLLYGCLWLYPLLRRKWRPLTGITVAGAASVFASVAALGWQTVLTYFRDNPVMHRMPSYYFSTHVNQSLLGESLRLVPYHMSAFGPPMHDPLYLITAAIVGVVTVVLVFRAPATEEGEAVAFNLLILGGMLIYPWTLSNYYVLLMVPMAFLWARAGKLPLGAGWTVLLLSVVYPITYYGAGVHSVWATILLWLVSCWLAVHMMRAAREVRGEQDLRAVAL